MHNNITYINPWLLPANIILSTNLEHKQQLFEIINCQKTNTHSIHHINSSKYCQYLIKFALCIGRHNIGNHNLMGHYLPTLSLFHKTLQQLIPNLQREQYSIKWTSTNDLMNILLRNIIFDLKVWHEANAKQIIESMLEAVAICTERKYDYNILDLYSKYIYLLVKIRYNNFKTAPKIKQNEQISVLPWTIPDTQQVKVGNDLKKRWEKIKKIKINKYIEEKENYDKTHKQRSHHNKQINNAISKPKPIKMECDIDAESSLWNKSKMSDISYDGNVIRKIANSHIF